MVVFCIKKFLRSKQFTALKVFPITFKEIITNTAFTINTIYTYIYNIHIYIIYIIFIYILYVILLYIYIFIFIYHEYCTLFFFLCSVAKAVDLRKIGKYNFSFKKQQILMWQDFISYRRYILLQ